MRMEEQENIACLNIRRHANSNIGLNLIAVNYWNQLSDEIVSYKSLPTFNIKLDDFMTAKGEL